MMDWRICIAFPNTQHYLCNSVAKHVRKTFNTECDVIIYDFNKDKIKQIQNILQEKCILIIGYEGKISIENSYKLGLAHAHGIQVILVNLLPLFDKGKNNINSGVPLYVRYQYLIIFDPENPKEFLDRIESILSVLLKGSLIDALYQRALDIWTSVEDKARCSIQKTNKTSFEDNLLNLPRSERDSLYDLYINNDDSLYDILVSALAENIEMVLKVLYNHKKDDTLTLESGGDTIIHHQEIHQHGKLDNYAGDDVKGNKTE